MEFKELKIIEPILKALESEGYKKPTPIQEKTIPLLLEKQDVIGIAQTGTGKTAAFVVPILQKLEENKTERKIKFPKALILAPTRELAAQISESFKIYGKFLHLKHLAVYGGVGITPQIKTIQKGIDILIATPGRLLDLMNQRKINLEKIEFLVLDEADRMLDMGFLKDVDKIISTLPKEKQSLFYSATMSREIINLTEKFLKKPKKIEITPESTPVERIEQLIFFIDQENKIELLLDLLKQKKMGSTLIFVSAKYKADKIARLLDRNKIRTDAIHGNKSQYQRTKALENFKKGKIKILVATDIAARGIDVDNITHVINYDLPNEPENYIHRIGRTARAGNKGKAYSFCAAEDRNFLNQIERLTKKQIEQAEHKHHSTKAKFAKGEAARPPKRKGRGGNRGNNRGGSSRNGNRRTERSRTNIRGSSRGNKGGRSRFGTNGSNRARNKKSARR